MVTPRDQLAVQLRAVLAPAVTVYSFPPEVVRAPAVVLVPRSPYRSDDTYGTERWALTALCLIVRAGDVQAGWDALDVLVSDVRAVVKAQPRAVWEGADNAGNTVPVGGVEYLSATCQVSWHEPPTVTN